MGQLATALPCLDNIATDNLLGTYNALDNMPWFRQHMDHLATGYGHSNHLVLDYGSLDIAQLLYAITYIYIYTNIYIYLYGLYNMDWVCSYACLMPALWMAYICLMVCHMVYMLGFLGCCLLTHLANALDCCLPALGCLPLVYNIAGLPWTTWFCLVFGLDIYGSAPIIWTYIP